MIELRHIALGLIAFATLWIAAGATQAQEALELRMSVTATQVDPLFAAAERAAERIAQRTEGRVKITPFAGTQLGGEREQLEAVKLGTTQIAAVGINGSNSFLAMFAPYLFRDMDHQGRVIDSAIAQPWKDEILKQQGLRFIGYAYQNPRHLTSNREVRVPADVDGLRIRVPQLPVLLETWKIMGANPVPMGVTEVFLALKQGVVDAQENPIEQIINNSFYEAQDYLVLLGYSRPVISVLMSDKVWQRISPADQKIIVDTFAEAREEHKREIQADEQKRIDFVQSKGVTVIEPDIAAFRAATASVAKSFGDKVWGPGVYEQIVNTK